MKFSSFIYGLKNPKNEDIFYIGCTQHSLKTRLNQHYFNASEVSSGRRVLNDRLKYIIELFPIRCEIFLIEEVDECDMYSKEIEYIELYKSLGYKLTNGTGGGIGGATYKFLSEERKKEVSQKISNSNIGIVRTQEYKDNLSKNRLAYNNTSKIRTQKFCPLVAFNEYGDVIQLFKFGFEINFFLGVDKAFGNVCKTFKSNKYPKPYGYIWRRYEDLIDFHKTEADKTYEDLKNKILSR